MYGQSQRLHFQPSTRPLSVVVVLLLVSATIVALFPAPTAAATYAISRVTVASDGTQANHDAAWPSISGDGRYVAFWSWATNLVDNDTNNKPDIFVHDRETKQTTRVSVASGGEQANASSEQAEISSDGRYVAFQSYASNLVDGDTNNQPDIFVHDRETKQTTRVSVASDGSQSTERALYPSISGDGRFVTFDSGFNNLVGFFVHDRDTGQTTHIPGVGGETAISATGRYVAFAGSGVIVYDREVGQLKTLSLALDGTQGNAYSYGPAISADGRYVAFQSYASNLVSNDTNEQADVFVHDRVTGQTRLVSHALDGQVGNNASYNASISADGRYIAFASDSSNLVAGDTNSYVDTFLYDRVTEQMVRLSIAPDGTQGNGHTIEVFISQNGRQVVFGSTASNFVNGDTNAIYDMFVYDLGAAAPETYSISGRVIDTDGSPIIGATIFVGSSRQATTDEGGNYSIVGLEGGIYTLHLESSKYSFDPPLRTVTVPPNATEQNFIGTAKPAKTTIEYFALGDSNASGHGLRDNGSACRRSSDAYPYIVADRLGDRYTNVSFPQDNFLACSGATALEPKTLTDSNHWLRNQVDQVVRELTYGDRPADRPILVSITIGMNDYPWAPKTTWDHLGLVYLANQRDVEFRSWVDGLTTRVGLEVKAQVQRLLKFPNVKIILTEYHNPWNQTSHIVKLITARGQCGSPLDKMGCYERVEYAIHMLNASLISQVVVDLQQPDRVAIALEIHKAFHGHESPEPECGTSSPAIRDTWIQHPSDRNSNSIQDPSQIPEKLRKLSNVKQWRGDCFHPNDSGAYAYAKAVDEAAFNKLGR